VSAVWYPWNGAEIEKKSVEEECGRKNEFCVVVSSLRSADDGDLGTVAGQCLGHTLADTGSTTYVIRLRVKRRKTKDRMSNSRILSFFYS
jgi:hypothetical protein